MTIDFNRIPRGYRNEGVLPKRNSIYMGLVRKNFDPQHMGRLLVWISDFGPDNEEYWLPVSYASPFAGATPVAETREAGRSMDDSQKSYGFWAVPPDKDNQVLCCFLDGDIANGFWFACIYAQNMNHMVPAISAGTSTDEAMNSGFAAGPPVVEYNKNDANQSPRGEISFDPTAPSTVQRPVFEPLATGIQTQGLQQDKIRGVGNTSARREAPSRAYGFLSPRGNGWAIDDGSNVNGIEADELIRLRTRSGVQLLINETSGYIYMITKEGKSWVEISDNGIDMYSAEPISIASDKDVNIHAGGKLNMMGTQGMHIASSILTSFTSGSTNFASDENIYLDATNDIGLKSSRDVSLDAVRDVTGNAGRHIIDGACGNISRAARMLFDNTGGLVPPEVPHAQFERSPILRQPTHEPFDRSSYGAHTFSDAAGMPTGVGQDGADVAVTGATGDLRELLDYIARYEAVRGSYDSAEPSEIIPGLSRMKVRDALALALRRGLSSRSTGAVGRYQFVNNARTKTFPNVVRATNTPLDGAFSPQVQDNLARHLIAQRARGKRTIRALAESLSMEWAGLPCPSKNGASYYAGQGGPNPRKLAEFLEILKRSFSNVS